jgi:beta-N-acetylhexosaminidase
MRSRPRSRLSAYLGATLAPVVIGVVALPVGPVVPGGPASPPLVAAETVGLTLTPAAAAQAVYDRMTPAQRIGQLFMVEGPAFRCSSPSTKRAATCRSFRGRASPVCRPP